MDESDDVIAARLRAKRGQPPLRRVPPWRQLLDLTLANVHEMIMTPGMARDDGTLDLIDDIVAVLSQGDAANAFRGEFAVHTSFAMGGGLEEAVVERQIGRVVHAKMGVDEQDVGWWQHNTPSRALVHFDTQRYVSIVRTIHNTQPSTGGALALWIGMFNDGPILIQHLLKNERLIGAPADWHVVKVEAPAELRAGHERYSSIPFVDAKDGDDRATLWLAKREDSWINHDGLLMTPWGEINCADGPPVIREGTQLARDLDGLRDGDTLNISTDVWTQGLVMPSFDRGRVRRILGAQTVLAEVPLAA
jgi:hypothetical protein